MDEASTPARRIRGAIARVVKSPGAAGRRHDDLVRRDDVEHHLLWSLHERIGELTERVERLQAELTQVDQRVEQVRESSSSTAEGSVSANAAATAAANRTAALREAVANLTSDVATLAVQNSGIDPPVVVDGPLVSVVLPTWQRAGWIGAAIRSVQAQTYPNWELLVVDDGSGDGTAERIAPLLDDTRITYEVIDHSGVPTARNRALELARGEIVAYLDTDNSWHPTHLARHVDAYDRNPAADWAFSGQAVVDGARNRAELRKDHRSVESLPDGSFIDLNMLSHRRAVLDEIGAFDLTLPRLGDWDLVVRLSQHGPPERIAATTVTYRTDSTGRITDTLPVHVARHRIRSRYRGLPAEGLKVLMAEWHFPQLTETYIAAVANGFDAIGAEVEVWAEEEPAVSAGSKLTVHRGSLEDAIDAFRPDVVVTHWIHKGLLYRPITEAAGLPHVVRQHGFEHDPGRIARLLDDDGVMVHVFPHLLEPAWADHPRLSVQVTCFDDDRYAPAEHKDRHLVLRTSAGLLTKDLDTFLLAANLCPDHRFVLVLGHALHVEERTEITIERAAELGSRAEIRVDVPYDEMAALMGSAGIYLHTHGTDHVVGMPMSVAEAMATGSYVLARDLPGVEAYLGGAGALYSGPTPEARAEAAAQLIDETTRWSDSRWQEVAARAADQAFSRHANSEVAEKMLVDWRAAFPQLPR